jgi:hypothetical protein
LRDPEAADRRQPAFPLVLADMRARPQAGVDEIFRTFNTRVPKPQLSPSTRSEGTTAYTRACQRSRRNHPDEECPQSDERAFKRKQSPEFAEEG